MIPDSTMYISNYLHSDIVSFSLDYHSSLFQIETSALSKLSWGAFIYDIRFLGRQVGQAASDFTKQAYVVNHLIRVGRQVKNTQKTSDVIYECSLFQNLILCLFKTKRYVTVQKWPRWVAQWSQTLYLNDFAFDFTKQSIDFE